MSDRVSDYEYALPEGLIASRPAARRDEARMLVMDRRSGRISHEGIRDLPGHFRPGDLAVLNDSRVMKARLIGGAGEVFLIGEASPLIWKCFVRPGRRFRAGVRHGFCGHEIEVVGVEADGVRLIRFDREPELERIGQIPIPHYFGRDADAEDEIRYQTIFARDPGSVAAPTAGLHFTPELLAAIPHVFVTLHVGPGTFQTVKVEEASQHKMHEEAYSVSAATAARANAAERIFAVGTTTARVLESLPPGPLAEASGRTRIFLRPPYEFRRVGALLTNFHLPKSTLLMLVSAFAGRENVLAAYDEAIRRRYRFYSYGDCMLII